MKRSQRIVLVFYCLLIAYCCVWIPWHVPNRAATTYERAGYGWLWAGPSPKGDIFDQIAADPNMQRAVPDLELMGFRLLAVSAVSGAAFLFAGILKSQQH